MAGILQFFQSKISIGKQKTKKGDFSSMMQSQMLYFFPFFTVLIVWKLGSIIGLYWIVSTLFSIGEQYIINSKSKNQNDK
jgi:membrane protein insertase Oxa1/YidC/SpoIIIJ